jgi:hypothetical protein
MRRGPRTVRDGHETHDSRHPVDDLRRRHVVAWHRADSTHERFAQAIDVVRTLAAAPHSFAHDQGEIMEDIT